MLVLFGPLHTCKGSKAAAAIGIGRRHAGRFGGGGGGDALCFRQGACVFATRRGGGGRRGGLRPDERPIHTGFPRGREWEELVDEFERRAEQTGGNRSRAMSLRDQLSITAGKSSQFNPKVLEGMPLIESAFMASLLMVMWFFGRYLRMDAFLILFYPMPIFLVAFRWGARYAALTVCIAVAIMMFDMGPLFAISFACNTGFMSVLFSVAMAAQWHWLVVLLFGTVGKCVGFVLNIKIQGLFFKQDLWKLVRDQAVLMCEAISVTVAKTRGSSVAAAQAAAPSPSAINAIMVWLFVFSSVYHAFFTYFSASVILDGYHYLLNINPTLMPIVTWLRNKQIEAYNASLTNSNLKIKPNSNNVGKLDKVDDGDSASSSGALR